MCSDFLRARQIKIGACAEGEIQGLDPKKFTKFGETEDSRKVRELHTTCFVVHKIIDRDYHILECIHVFVQEDNVTVIQN